MSEKNALVVVVEAEDSARAEPLPYGEDPTEPKPGRWYWVRPMTRVPDGVDEDGDPKYKLTDDGENWVYVIDPDDSNRDLNCVTDLGSNYVEVADIFERTERIHTDEFWARCEFEPDPNTYITRKVTYHQNKTAELMGAVRELTARLAISAGSATLGQGANSEVAALAVRTSQPMNDYKASLVRAKETDLPELFKEIEKNNEMMAVWLKASLIPLKAEAKALRPAMNAIKERIYSVELYAGLVEQVVQVKDGEPAPFAEKIHLFQRRAYMDEECLAQYEVGGMDFRDIRDFDAWLVRPDNLERLLPHPRCVVAFRIRRNEKHYEAESLADFIQILDNKERNLLTFLYLRNGGQVYRLSTEYEFGEKLFPDMDRQKLEGKLWAKMSGSCVRELITDNEYQGILEKEAENDRRAAEAPESESYKYISSYFKASRDYEHFSPDNVHYDDIAAYIQKEVAKHNRLVLILQGLLDRSPVFHPHPPWSIWSGEGFGQALSLVYDDSRALVAGEKPDFEAYRAQLNASLKEGCVTIGQERSWLEHEAEKENERRSRDYRYREGRDLVTYRPYGNLGPGKLAKIAHFAPRTRKCTFVWGRQRQRNTWDPDKPQELRCTFTTDAENVLNVSAYKPGDFKRFFADPRTRQEYLKWAPLLLEAEEYHAGNRKVYDNAPPPTRKARTEEGSEAYRLRKQRKALVGKAVRLKDEVITRSGKTYAKGTLWRVSSNHGRDFTLVGIDESGASLYGDDYRILAKVGEWDFRVDPDIPSGSE